MSREHRLRWVPAVLLSGAVLLAPASAGEEAARTPPQHPAPVAGADRLLKLLDCEQIVVRMPAMEVLTDLLQKEAVPKLLAFVETGPSRTVFPLHIRKQGDQARREREETEWLWRERNLALDCLARLGALAPDVRERILIRIEAEEVESARKAMEELVLQRQDEKRREAGGTTAFQRMGGLFWVNPATKEHRLSFRQTLTRLLLDPGWGERRLGVGLPKEVLKEVESVLSRLPKPTSGIRDEDVPEYTARLWMVRDLLAEQWRRSGA